MDIQRLRSELKTVSEQAGATALQVMELDDMLDRTKVQYDGARARLDELKVKAASLQGAISVLEMLEREKEAPDAD